MGKDMALAFQKPLGPAPAPPPEMAPEGAEPEIEIPVVFTSLRATLRALREAAALARPMGAQVTLVVPQVVPHPLPLESPPVLLDFAEKRFFTLADQSRVPTTVRIYLCRDRDEVLKDVLRAGSMVVLGGPRGRRWWPSAEMRMTKRLRQMGHEVVFVETD